jgi:hypothetical protein
MFSYCNGRQSVQLFFLLCYWRLSRLRRGSSVISQPRSKSVVGASETSPLEKQSSAALREQSLSNRPKHHRFSRWIRIIHRLAGLEWLRVEVMMAESNFCSHNVMSIKLGLTEALEAKVGDCLGTLQGFWCGIKTGERRPANFAHEDLDLHTRLAWLDA